MPAHPRLLFAPLGEPRGRHTGPGHYEYVSLSEIFVPPATWPRSTPSRRPWVTLPSTPTFARTINEIDAIGGTKSTSSTGSRAGSSEPSILAALVEETARLAELLALA